MQWNMIAITVNWESVIIGLDSATMEYDNIKMAEVSCNMEYMNTAMEYGSYISG